MKKVLLVLTIVSGLLLSSCTENTKAKQFGGTAELELPAGQKLITVTWKADALWYLTKPMTENDVPETYKFQEESAWGMMEGTYIIKEKR